MLAKLKAKSSNLLLVARELALDLADGTFAPDVVEHVPGVANVIPDVLSRRLDPAYADSWQLPQALRNMKEAKCPDRDAQWWRTLVIPTERESSQRERGWGRN